MKCIVVNGDDLGFSPGVNQGIVVAHQRGLLGCLPTHLDSHHSIHRRPWLTPDLLELTAQDGMPMKVHSPVRYLSSFYRQWMATLCDPGVREYLSTRQIGLVSFVEAMTFLAGTTQKKGHAWPPS